GQSAPPPASSAGPPTTCQSACGCRHQICWKLLRRRTSEVDGELQVTEVRVTRAKGGRGEGLRNVLAMKEVAEARLHLRIACHRPADNAGDFGAKIAAVAGVHAVAGAGGCGGSAARHAADLVKAVVRICQPEAVAHDSEADARMRLELKDATDI